MCFWLGQFAVAVQKGEKIVRAESVVAEKFDLVGPDGRQTASLQSIGAGEGVLILRGGHGKGRLELGIMPGGEPSVAFYDSKGRCRLSLHLEAAGADPIVVLRSSAEGPSLRMSNGVTGPELTIHDAHAVDGPSLSIGLDEGDPTIDIRRGEGPHVRLRARRSGPEIELYDHGGPRILPGLRMHLNDRAEPRIALAGSEGNTQAVLSVIRDAPELRLLGKRGFYGPNTRWLLLPDDSPAVQFSDGLRKQRRILTIDKEGKTQLRLLGAPEGEE